MYIECSRKDYRVNHPFDFRAIHGLADEEAARRLFEDGPNELPSSRRRTVFSSIIGLAKEPMFLLLVACGTVYLLIGEPREAAMLLGFVFVIMGITVVQERRTENALEALRDLSSPRALVIRSGEQKRIAGREVVRGDFIVLAEGDRVPADAVLRHALNFSADESLLTGESVPVRKVSVEGQPPAVNPGGDDLPLVFSGSLVTRGQGVAEVVATGFRSELGKIGKALQHVEQEDTHLQKETRRVVQSLAIVGLGLCALVVAVYGLTRGNDWTSWYQGILAGITMAMAILPEELPVVLTVFLAIGAWRISQSRVLTRRIPAVETLGAATVLCVDKTGTLTQNRMSVARLVVGVSVFDATRTDSAVLPERFHRLLEFGVLASKMEPFDPMEKALREFGDRFLARTEHLHTDWALMQEYPLSSELLALSHVWNSSSADIATVAAKGAPEAIADLCHLPDAEQRGIEHRAGQMAEGGLRVLGVARGLNRSKRLPKNQHDFDFEFLGLVGLADPIRPGVPDAIRECHTAGIRVVMMTGDYPATAKNIGRQIGLDAVDQLITGPELAAMGDAELAERVRTVSIFARVVPEQKLRIVQALKANGEVVAMTGDGVNDAPALKAANIGIAMGGRGTDVARESSSLVLLDDDFSSIVRAVRLGRRIFDNIRKAICYIFAVHVPIVGLSFLPVVLGDWPLILLPMHIVFLELIIDPACSLVFEAEAEEANVMERPPRSRKERLFSWKALAVSLLQGVIVLAIVFAVYFFALNMRHSADNARGLTFATLVVANLGLILTNRSWSRTIISMLREPNGALYWVIAGAVVFLCLVLYVPSLRHLFHFEPVHRLDLLICLAAGGASIGWFELLKMRSGRKPITRRTQL